MAFLQVLLDKNAHLKTVVNKTGNIESEFRVFPMEVIAGIHSTETEVVQHGTRFKLDFAKVAIA
jgi:tRNA (guanine37-N1)-methyltransferase